MSLGLPRVSLLLAGLLALLAGGCSTGPKKYKVTGRVHRAGKALEVQPVIGRVRVVFQPVDSSGAKNGAPVEAVVNQTKGTFVVEGSDQQGLLPGRYRICVYQADPFPTDKLEGAFGEDKSPFLREVTGVTDFDLDLDKPG